MDRGGLPVAASPEVVAAVAPGRSWVRPEAMTLETRGLGDLIVAGLATSETVRLWIRVARPGTYRVELHGEARTPVAFDVQIAAGPTDGTHALTVPTDVPGLAPLGAGTRHWVRLLDGDRELSAAAFRTAPAGRSTAPRRWTFGAFSCHQPFSRKGAWQPEAVSMLRAAHRILSEQDAAFVMMLGDQMYADYPRGMSLHDPAYFRRVAPSGRRSLLECSAREVRSLYQQRHQSFWASEHFVRIQRSFATYPMLDDHEVVDNFGTHPDHATPQWRAIRAGALDAVYDYQISRVLPLRPDGTRPEAFDYGFVWGPAAVWMMDVRSQRRTDPQGRTRVFTPQQLGRFAEFLERHAELPLLVVAVPIPLVYVEGWVADAVGQLLGQGSDMHERWSHHSCIDERNRWLALLLRHAAAHPHRRILFLGGDVHDGAAFAIDFDGFRQMYQLTSSAICNTESIVTKWACEWIARSTDSLDLPDGTHADIGLLPGTGAGRPRNPFGGLNLGLVDVIDHGDDIALGLRLVTHDGHGNPVVVFDSGELGFPERTEAQPASRKPIARIAAEHR